MPSPSPVESPLSALFTYPELTPLVLEHLHRPSELATAARVCKQWGRYVTRRLYRDIWIRPWERAPKEKFLGLFDTLKNRPALCEMIHSLDVRFYPLEMQGEQLAELERDVALALEQMVNLQKLVWTRDRSTNVHLWHSIYTLPQLSHLEISGRTDAYSPFSYFDILRQIKALRDLRVIMPDPVFSMQLPDIIHALHARPQGGLHGLTLICKSNRWSNGEFEKVAPSLPQLRRLELLGIARIKQSGLMSILNSATDIEELIIEAPPQSNLEDIAEAHLASLRRVSISYPATKNGYNHVLQATDMPSLPRAASLRALELNITHRKNRLPRILSLSALQELQRMQDFSKLTRVALLNMISDRAVVAEIIRACPGLEELFIAVQDEEAVEPVRNTNLRILHINAEEAIHPAVLANLAETMPQVEEMGCLNRVFEVHRHWEGDERMVELTRWNRIYTPAYFQIWRP